MCNHRTNLESIVNLLVLVSNALTRCFSFRKISPHHLRCNPIEKYNLNCSAPSQVCASVFRLTEQTCVNTSLPQTPRIPCKYLRARQNPYHLWTGNSYRTSSNRASLSRWLRIFIFIYTHTRWEILTWCNVRAYALEWLRVVKLEHKLHSDT